MLPSNRNRLLEDIESYRDALSTYRLSKHYNFTRSLIVNYDRVDDLHDMALEHPGPDECFGPSNFLELYEAEDAKIILQRQLLLIPLIWISSAAIFNTLYSTVLQL